MICDEVRRIAYFFLDGQLGERRGSDLLSHIADCHDCDHRIVIHRRLRSFVVRRLSPRAAPESLRERIHRAMTSEQRPIAE